MNIRRDRAETPAERLLAVALRMWEQRGRRDAYPNEQEFQDFADKFDPFVERELLTRSISVAQRFGTYPFVIELSRQLDLVNFNIAKQDAERESKKLP